MKEGTKNFFICIGFEINKEKFATNSMGCNDDAIVLEISQVYNYLKNYRKKSTE